MLNHKFLSSPHTCWRCRNLFCCACSRADELPARQRCGAVPSGPAQGGFCALQGPLSCQPLWEHSPSAPPQGTEQGMWHLVAPSKPSPVPSLPGCCRDPHKSLWASTSIICPSSKEPFPPSPCLPPIPPFLVSPSPPSLHLSLMSSSSISPVSPSFILPSLLHPSIFHPAVSL